MSTMMAMLLTRETTNSLDSSHPKETKQFPPRHSLAPKNWRNKSAKEKKSSPSRLPASFPVLVSSRPTSSTTDRPATKIPLLSLLAIRINATNNRRGAPLNICIPSLITSPPVCTPAGGQPSTADHPLGVQPWRLPALDTAAESKTRGSLVWSRRRSVHDDGDETAAVGSMPALPAREIKVWAKSPPPPRRYHDIFWGIGGGVAGDIIRIKTSSSHTQDPNHQNALFTPSAVLPMDA